MASIKLILAAILALVVNVGLVFALNKYSVFAPKPQQEKKHEAAKRFKKTKAINIPVIEGKDVKGYFLIQFAFAATGSVNASSDEIAEIYLLDDALTRIYGIGNAYGAKLEKSQIAELAPKIMAAIQSKMGNDFVKEVLVQEFTYIPRADVK